MGNGRDGKEMRKAHTRGRTWSISKETKAWHVLLQETSKHEQQDVRLLGKLGETPDSGRQTPHVLSRVWVLASDLYMCADVEASVH